MTNAVSDSGPTLKEQLQMAAIDKIKAETARLGVEADSHREYLRTAKAKARVAEIELENEESVHKARLANDFHHKTLPLAGLIGPELVSLAITQLTTWSRTDPGCEITVYLNSPGGSMTHGFALFDFIRSIREQGHIVNIVVLGMAASMASVVLQAASDGCRKMGKEAWLMIHEASFGAGGKIGEIEDTTAWVKATQGRILDIYAGRAGGKASRTKFEKGWARKDWWISSDEALKLGLVDVVI